jgi:hypothetical protein
VFCYRYCSLWHRTVSARCGRGRSACPVWDRALAWLPAPAAVPAGCQHAQDYLVSEFPADLRRPPGSAFVHGPPPRGGPYLRRVAGQAPHRPVAAGRFRHGKRGKVIAGLADRMRRRGRDRPGSAAPGANRPACGWRCRYTARPAGPRRLPRPGPAAPPCQRGTEDVRARLSLPEPAQGTGRRPCCQGRPAATPGPGAGSGARAGRPGDRPQCLWPALARPFS